MAVAEDVGLVRAVWGAARDNDVDTLVALTAPNVDWRPTAVTSGPLHGQDALRDYLDGLAATGALLDAYPYSFEVLGDCVIVSGALRLRREDGAIESVRRWWVYRVTHGQVATAASHTSRHDACLEARSQHLDVRPNGSRPTRP